jgi:hypothetical protein
MVGPAGIEPAYAGLRPAANPSQLETRSRDPRSRTASLLNPNQADYRLPRSRDVLHGGDGGNRTRCDDACRACPLPQLSSPWRCGARYSQSPGVAGLSSAASPRSGRHGGPADNGAHAMDVSTSKHVHLRVVRAGTAGVEPAFRPGWSRVAYPLADPQINENRPGISLGRLPSSA